jgi:hypothetical protein
LLRRVLLRGWVLLRVPLLRVSLLRVGTGLIRVLLFLTRGQDRDQRARYNKG